MTESSLFWNTDGTGDGPSGGYTQTQMVQWLRSILVPEGTTDLGGVSAGYLNELEVTGNVTPVEVDTGAASVYGFPYVNTAVVSVAIPTPSVSTRIDRVVLRADWTAQTVRVTRVAGTEGGGAPAITQDAGNLYDISLAQVSITTGGAITITDERRYLNVVGYAGVTTTKIADSAVTTAKIANDNVTYAKIQNVATDRLLGRDTAGSGDVEEIGLGASLGFTGTGVIQRAALTGDVTAAANSNATTIASNAVTTAKIADNNVTLAKIQDITTDRLLGRDTAGTGDPEELTVSGGIEFSGSGGLRRSAITGDVEVAAGSSAATIPNGTISTAKLADSAVNNLKLAANSVGTGHIVTNGVQTTAIQNLAVTNAKLDNDSVTRSKLHPTSAFPTLFLHQVTSSAINNTLTEINLDTVLLSGYEDGILTFTGGGITVGATGLYEIIYSIVAMRNTAPASYLSVRVYKSGVAIDGSLIYGQDVSSFMTSSKVIYAALTSGNHVDLKGSHSAGSGDWITLASAGATLGIRLIAQA